MTCWPVADAMSTACVSTSKTTMLSAALTRHLAERQGHDLVERPGLLEGVHRVLRRHLPGALRVVTEVVAAHEPAEDVVGHRTLLHRQGEHRGAARDVVHDVAHRPSLAR